MSYNTTSTEKEGRTNECIKEEEEEEESAMSARQHQQPSFLIMTFSFDISEQQTQNWIQPNKYTENCLKFINFYLFILSECNKIVQKSQRNIGYM